MNWLTLDSRAWLIDMEKQLIDDSNLKHRTGRAFYWPAALGGLGYVKLVSGRSASIGVYKLIFLGYTIKYPILLSG